MVLPMNYCLVCLPKSIYPETYFYYFHLKMPTTELATGI